LGTVTKTAADGWGSAGYSSVESLTDDGYIEFTATESTTDRMVGLSTNDRDQSYTSIEYAWYLASGGGPNSSLIYFSGSSVGVSFGPYTPGVTVFRIAREGTSIKFFKDGVLQHTISVGVPSGPLHVDTAMYQNGCTIGPVSMHQ
jgi:hypothetical protein